MQFQESITEAFPFIQQILSDTYRIDAWLFTPPYEDFNKIDRGFRQLMWEKENFISPLGEAIHSADRYRFFIVKSTLDFYNIIAFVTMDSSPSFISLGPFRDREISETDLSRIISSHHLPAVYITAIRQFYYSLPVADPQQLTTAFRHLITPFLPQYQDVEAELINYSENQRSLMPNEESLRHFSYDAAESYSAHLNRFLDTLLTGNSEESHSALQSFLDFQGYGTHLPLKQMKKIISMLNTFCCSRMLTTQVHPGFILERFSYFDLQLENHDSPSSLLSLPYEIARKYCLLIKNYSFPEYSYLIRNVMNYVTLHLSEELSLAVIAEFFHKNPSYLSGQFRKETGESLTDYIQKERMQAAIRYFNTTNMSVAEVAGCVGIHDFGYFSRIFKKHIGWSPSQYRKMVKT